MAVGLGRFHSPGALARTERFRTRRRTVLESSEKTAGLKLRQVANQPNQGAMLAFRPGGSAQSLVSSMEDIVNRRTRSPEPLRDLLGLQSAGPRPGPSPRTPDQVLRISDEEELRRLRQIINTAPFNSPEFKAANQRIQELTAGANFTLPEAVVRAERAITEFAAPVTEPVGEAIGTSLARAAVAPAQPVRIAGEALDIPGAGAIPTFGEAAEAVRGPSRAIGREVLTPTNLIPLPIIDPLAAKALGLAFKAGARVSRPVLETLIKQGRRALASEAFDRITKEAVQKFVDDAARVLGSERGAARIPGGGDIPEGRHFRLKNNEVVRTLGEPTDPETGRTLVRWVRAIDERDVGQVGTAPLADATEVPIGEATAFEGRPVELPASETLRPDRGPPGELRPGPPPLPAIRGGSDPPSREGIRQTFVDAFTRSGPGREGREAARIYQGAVNEGNLGITNWQNRTKEVAEAAGVKAVKGARDAQTPETVTMMERIWGAIDPVTGRTARGALRTFPDNERPFVEAIYDRLDLNTRRIVEADPEYAANLLDDYFPHLFTPTKIGAGGRRLTTQVTGRRKLEGPLGAILDDRPDLDLITWNPIEIVARHEAAVNNYIASLDAIRNLKATGSIRPRKAAPSTWRRPNIASFRVGEKLDGFVAEPKVASKLEDMFSVSAFKTNGFLKPIEGTRAALFKIKVLGGLFQQVDFTARSIGLGLSELVRGDVKNALRAWFMPLRSTARSVNGDLDRRLLQAAEGNVDLTDGYKAGLAAGVDPSIADDAIRGLGGLLPQTVGGRQIPGAEWLQQVLEFISGGAYARFHRDMLEQGYLVMLQKNLRKGMPREEAVRAAVEETNVFFSSIPNWQSAVTNPTARDAMKLGFFATGELEGWFRLPFQAPAGFAGIIGATAIAAQMINKLSTGEWLSVDQLLPYEVDSEEIRRLKKDPRTIFDAGVPGVDYNTRFLRPELPWNGPDGRKLYLDLLGQSDTPFRWAFDPVFATQTRLGQFPRTAIDVQSVVRGEAPAFGEVVDSPADLARFAAQQISPISTTGLAGTERGAIGTTGAGIQVSGVNVSAEPLRETIGRKFQELHGREFNPSVDRNQALEDPELAALIRQADKLSAARGFEGGTNRQEREQLLEQQAEELRPFVDGVRRGEPLAGAAFRERFSQIKTFMAGAQAIQTFNVDFGDPSTGAEQALNELSNLSPFTPDFINPDTFEVDWEAYEAERERLQDIIEKDHPGYKAAVESRLRLPEEFQDVERQFQQARLVRDELSDISPVQGLTADQWKQIQDFLRDVNAQRMQWRLDPRIGEVPLEQAIAIIGRQQNKSRGFMNAANTLRGGVPDNLRNPEYDRFLLANSGTGQEPASLFLFYPELFRRQSLQLGIAQGQGVPVFQQPSQTGGGRGQSISPLALPGGGRGQSISPLAR